MQITEGVHETGSEQFGHLAAFRIGKACVFVVRLRILQVDLLVRNIQVTAENDRLLRIQADHVFPHRVFEAAAVIDALKTVLSVRRIAADEEKVLKLAGDDAAFMVVFLIGQAVSDRQRRDLRKDGRPAVALLFRIVPVFLIAGQVQFQLAFLQFRFLQAENVGVQRRKILAEILAEHRPQPVDVP